MKNLIRFFKNVYTFRKDLWSHTRYDSMDSLAIFNTSLKNLSKHMHRAGNQGFHFNKRRSALDKTISLIDKVLNHDYLEASKIKKGTLYDGETSFASKMPANNNLSELLKESMAEEDRDWSRIVTLLKSKQFGIRSWWH